MKTPRLLVCLLACAAPLAGRAQAAPPAGESALREIFGKPGGWDQMCSLPPALSYDVPVPRQTPMVLSRSFFLGKDERARVQRDRETYVQALVAALEAMDLTRPSEQTRGSTEQTFGKEARSGLRPDWLNSIHLQLIDALQAVEALPALLRLEEQLHTMEASVVVAKEPEGVKLPELDGFAFFTMPDGARPADPREPEGRRQHAVFTLRVYQREVLATMLLLLQREKFPGVAASDALRRSVAGRGGVRDVVPYSDSLRSEVRRLAQDFLRTVPPERRLGAKAMPTEAKR